MTIAVSAARLTVLQAAMQENNPVLAWDNLAAAAGVIFGGTATLTDGDAENAVDGATYDFWLPDVTLTTASFDIQLASAQTLSFGALAAHNLADFGGSVRLRRSPDGIAWSDAGAGLVTPTNNRPIAFRNIVSGRGAAWWQFYFTGLTVGDALAVGVAFFGNELVVPQRVYQSFVPAITPTEVALQSNVSVGGNLLGSSVVNRGSRIEIAPEHLTPAFVRGTSWKDFQTKFNEGGGAFLGWRPDDHPEDVFYMWRDGPVIRPAPAGVRDYQNAVIAARVYET